MKIEKKFNDDYFMKKAIHLAKKGTGKTSPNPIVGAVIVKNGKIIGSGYHQKYGDNHAEIIAIKNSSGSVKGTTLFITLEPCCHHGNTPPCVDTIIKEKIKRVVVGTIDPNPNVNGKGIKILKSNGILVDVGILERECLELNESYFKYVKSGIPFVTVKYAQTLDGRIATKTGNSQWISSAPSRKYSHYLRGINDCVLVGIGTIKSDNPKLTVRHVKGRNPLRVIVDSKLSIPLRSNVLTDNAPQRTIVATTSQAPSKKVSAIEKLGVEVMIVKKDKNGGVSLDGLLKKLGRKKIVSIMVEGGPQIITSLLKAKLVDKMIIFTSPKILGEGTNAIGDLKINKVKDAIKFSSFKTIKKGDDFVFTGKL